MTENGVLIETPHSRLDFPWDAFFRARIGPDLVRVYRCGGHTVLYATI